MFNERRFSAPVFPWLLACWMLAMGLAAQIAPAADKASQRKASDLLPRQGQIEQTIRALQDSSLPGRPISPADIVKQVGKDPQKLCDYVRNQIAFEPYRGFLKGAVGVLSSGRGNSADRAMLLAAILDSAGVKARLVKGTVVADKFPSAAMPAATKPGDRAAETAALKSCGIDVDELDRAMKVAQLDKQKSLEELWQRVDRDVQTLAKALDDGKVPVPWPAAEPSTEHWWVRTDAGDHDPTLAQAGAKESGAWDVKDIPAKEFHTIVFREVIVAGGKPQTVLEAKYRACDLFGKAVAFANLAMDWQQQATKSPSPSEALGSLKDNRRFRASICVEDKGTPGKVFDVDGQILKDDGSQIGGAKALGGGLGGMFGGGGEDKPQSKLDSCRLEVEIAAPGDRTPMVVRRSLLRPGAGAAQKVYDLCTTYEFLVLPEDVSEALIARKAAETFEKIGQWLKDCGDKDPLADPGHRKIARLNGELWGFGLARRNEVNRLGQTYSHATFVHQRATLAAYFRRMIDAKSPRAVRGIDIFYNQMQAVGAKPQGWSDHPGLWLGAMDTALEQVSLERPGGACHNSSMLLEKARLAGKEPILLKAAGNELAKTFGDAAGSQMSADLKGAVLVAIPGEVVAWYRVDLAGGATLGYVENGGGQAAVEHIEDSALVWMVYEYMKIYCEAVHCLGLGLSMGISMDPDEQRKEFAVCTCEVALEVATSLACIAREADPVTLLDFGQFFAVSKGWGNIVKKICEKAFEGGEGGHGGEGGGE